MRKGKAVKESIRSESACGVDATSSPFGIDIIYVAIHYLYIGIAPKRLCHTSQDIIGCKRIIGVQKTYNIARCAAYPLVDSGIHSSRLRLNQLRVTAVAATIVASQNRRIIRRPPVYNYMLDVGICLPLDTPEASTYLSSLISCYGDDTYLHINQLRNRYAAMSPPMSITP